MSFLLVVGLIAALIPLAKRVELLDTPHGHKTHQQPTPLVGGIAIYGALLVLVFFQGVWPDFSAYRDIVLAAFLLVLFGVIDDYRHLPVPIRLVSQVFVATAVCLVTGIEITSLGDLTGTGEILLGSMAVPFTVFALVGAMNALNMVDGIDGLAGGLMIIILGAMATIAGLGGDLAVMALLIIIMAAIAGFLLYNLRVPGRKHAHVFLGDAGSMLLGLLVGYFLVAFAQGEHRLMAPVTALWIFALPLLDVFVVMLRRYQEDRSLFKPANDHFHHHLLRAGYSVPKTVAMLVGAQLLFCLAAVAALHLAVPEYLMFYTALIIFIILSIKAAVSHKIVNA